MKDAERISDGNDLRAQLLRSARRDVVPAAAKARNVAAVVATATALHARTAAAAALKALLIKAAVVTAVGISAFGAYRYVGGDHAPTAGEAREAREVHEVAAGPTPLRREAPEQVAPRASAGPPRTDLSVAAMPSAAPLAAASGVRLAEEVATLDRARAALLGGDGEGALVELGHYHHDFPAAQLGREATLLEIDALEKSGQHRRAQELARVFIHANPQSPAAKRLSSTYE